MSKIAAFACVDDAAAKTSAHVVVFHSFMLVDSHLN